MADFVVILEQDKSQQQLLCGRKREMVELVDTKSDNASPLILARMRIEMKFY